MTAPIRLIEADDEFERDLIRSAHGDRPSDRGLERMLLGLGVELSCLPSALSSPAASTAGSGKLGAALLAKWLVTGAAIGLTGIGGAELVVRALDHKTSSVAAATKRSASASPKVAASFNEGSSLAAPEPIAPVSPSAVTPAARSRIATSPVLNEPSAPPALAPSTVAPEPREATVSTAPSAVGSFATLAPRPDASLAEEMRLLDTARGALSSGAARSALSALASYERAFPNGALRPEASVLKVRALLAAGDRAAAETLGQQVIERAPRSEHAAAVRAALGLRSNP